jgi:hypothetical protein
LNTCIGAIQVFVEMIPTSAKFLYTLHKLKQSEPTKEELTDISFEQLRKRYSIRASLAF